MNFWKRACAADALTSGVILLTGKDGRPPGLGVEAYKNATL